VKLNGRAEAFASARLVPGVLELFNGLPCAGDSPPLYQWIQRTGEQATQYQYKGFVTTTTLDGPDPLIADFPKRWHVEEFFTIIKN
jgi:hypothetical protein